MMFSTVYVNCMDHSLHTHSLAVLLSGKIHYKSLFLVAFNWDRPAIRNTLLHALATVIILRNYILGKKLWGKSRKKDLCWLRQEAGLVQADVSVIKNLRQLFQLEKEVTMGKVIQNEKRDCRFLSFSFANCILGFILWNLASRAENPDFGYKTLCHVFLCMNIWLRNAQPEYQM